MAYSAKAIANKFIEIAKAKGSTITPMKLQKLVYFAHGWYLSLTNAKPLIDEKIEAWRYGPVVPSLYHQFKSLGNRPIEEYATDFQIEPEIRFITPNLPEDKNLFAFMEKIWDVYGKFTAIQLSNLTHQSDTPWAKVWTNGDVPKGTGIDDSIIKEYFDKARGNPLSVN